MGDKERLSPNPLPRGCRLIAPAKIPTREYLRLLTFRKPRRPEVTRANIEELELRKKQIKNLFDALVKGAAAGNLPQGVLDTLKDVSPSGKTYRGELMEALMEYSEGKFAVVCDIDASYPMEADGPFAVGDFAKVEDLQIGNGVTGIRSLTAKFVGIVLNTNSHYADPVPVGTIIDVDGRQMLQCVNALLGAHGALHDERPQYSQGLHSPKEIEAAIDWVSFKTK
ncbi:MAG: hypothetical protein Q7S79_03010 [bacterium]|nr:hypothetical protein [bacterium]